MSQSCPGRRQLQAFSVGNLTASSFQRIDAHVECCANCKETLRSFDCVADELVAELQEAKPKATAAETVPEVLLERAREAIHGRRTGGKLVMDSGQRLASALQKGTVQLGKFELVEQLGIGAFGTVFKAIDRERDRWVALKVERGGGVAQAKEQHERFLRESRSIAALDHSNIVSLYETGETDDGAQYLVMELVEGDTLQDRLAVAPPAFDETAALLIKIGETIHYAHEAGVVHRDLKPSNILIDAQFQPHVMDFGLARREVGDPTLTTSGEVLGTPAYMSPELARGEAHHVDRRSDVYSLGVMLYELVTGERPFQGNRRMLMLQVLEDEPRAPRRLYHGIPRDLETICLRAMEKNPAHRYPTAQAFAEDLRRYLARQPITAKPLGKHKRLLRWCRRNPLAASLFLVLVLSFALGLVHLSQLIEQLVLSSAEDSAEQYAELLEVVNDLYASEVVQRAGEHGVQATATYAAESDEIPLPATLLTLLLKRISEGQSGMSGRHFSNHPFRGRENGGPHDDFERSALAWLQQNPSDSYSFVEERDEGTVLRLARARIMKQSCVDCHNHHPDSVKTDWQVGDVRGVLEIIRPLDHDVERIRAGMRGTFFLVVVVSLGLALFFAIFVFLSQRQGR